MSIPVFKTLIHEEAIDNVNRVLRSGWTGLGKEVERFEEELAKYLGAKYCVALNSCTAALELAVAHLNLPFRSLVITTPNTFVSTNHVLLHAHLEPIFADIDESGSISVKSIERILNWNWPEPKRIKAIMVVHYGGQPADLDEIYALAKKHNLYVIEDCAHACGAIYKGRKIGSIGKYNCFSFHSVKNLATADGGALVTDDQDVYELAKKMRWLGIDASTIERTSGGYRWEYDVPLLGFKNHMSDVIAAIARGQLLHLDEDNEIRKSHVDEYLALLDGIKGIKPLLRKPDRISSNHLFVIRFEDSELRRRAMEALTANNIQFSFHYKANYRYPMYKGCMRDKGSEMRIFELTALTLPLHLYLSKDQIHTIINVIKEAII